jgi:hypothetical protein
MIAPSDSGAATRMMTSSWLSLKPIMGCEFPGFNDLRVLPAKICYNFIKNCCPISCRAKRGPNISGAGTSPSH